MGSSVDDAAGCRQGQTKEITVDSASVVVRYWAGARAAAGVAQEPVAIDGVLTVEGLRAEIVARHTDIVDVLRACSIVVDGRASSAQTEIPAAAVVDVLPPFAGG